MNTIVKRVFILLGALVFSNYINAQNSEEEIHSKFVEYMNLAEHYNEIDLDSSIYFFDQAELIKSEIKDDSLISISNFMIANVFFRRGNLTKAADIYMQEYNKAHFSNNIYLLSKANLSLANVHLMSNEFEKSIEKYQEVIQVSENVDSLGRIYVSAMMNKGIAYQSIGKFLQAERMFKKGLDISIDHEYNILMGNSYSNLGSLEQARGNYKLALDYMWKAHDIRNEEGIQYNISQTLGHIADIQFILKDFREAEKWALKSIEVSESINAHYLTKMAFEILHKTYFELGNYEKAYTVLKKKMAIELLLIKEEQEDRLKLVSTKYKFKLKQEHESAEVAKKNYMLLVLFVLSVLVSSILFFFYKKKEAKGIQDSLLNEKLELENKLLGEELDFKNKEVMTKVMYLVKKNELIESIVKRLVILRSSLKNENRQEVFSIVRELRNETSSNDVWEEFETYFNTIQSDFYARLNENFELSQNERRLSAFLKLDMTTKEISTISGQTIRSIEVARYRLRKKLNIPKELGISEFLARV